MLREPPNIELVASSDNDPSGIVVAPSAAYRGLHHVTAHAVGNELILRDHRDKSEFLARFRNYLEPSETRNSAGTPYVKLFDEVALITFGLLNNHYHLILQELVLGGVNRLMRRTQPAYSRYFNDRYTRRGPLYDRSFEPTPIVDAAHARRAIAYVHLNHVVEQLEYRYTGHRLFVGEDRCDWVNSEAGIKLYGSVGRYKRYLNRHGPAIIDRKLQKYGMCRETYKYRPIE